MGGGSTARGVKIITTEGVLPWELTNRVAEEAVPSAAI
jgi:hypothetical protein